MLAYGSVLHTLSHVSYGWSFLIIECSKYTLFTCISNGRVILTFMLLSLTEMIHIRKFHDLQSIGLPFFIRHKVTPKIFVIPSSWASIYPGAATVLKLKKILFSEQTPVYVTSGGCATKRIYVLVTDYTSKHSTAK